MGPHGERVRQVADTQDLKPVLEIPNDPALDQDVRGHLGAALEQLGEAAQIHDRILFPKEIGEAALLRQALVQWRLAALKPGRYRVTRVLALVPAAARLAVAAANATPHPIVAVARALGRMKFAEFHTVSPLTTSMATRWAILRIIPRICGLFVCTRERCRRRRPRASAVNRCLFSSPIGLRTSVTLILLGIARLRHRRWDGFFDRPRRSTL